MTGRPSPAPRAQPPQWLRNETTIAGRLLILTAAALALLWLLMQVRLVTVAVFLAFAQAALLWPADRILRRWLPNTLAALVCVTAYLAAFLAMAWFIVVEIVNSWPEMSSAVVGGVYSANSWALDRGPHIPPEMVANIQTQLQNRTTAIASGVSSAAMSTIGVLGMLATILGLAIFLTLFALATGDRLWYSFRNALPQDKQAPANSAFRAALKTARGWMFASTITGLVDGVFIGLGLYLLGIPLALPIGALTFVLGYIPMVGATLAGGVAIIVALFFGGPSAALWTLVIVLVVQQVEGNVLSPVLMSQAMDFNPIVTLLLASLGGAAFGILGLFLAVPLCGIVMAAVNGWRHEVRQQSETERRELADRELADSDQ